MDAILRRYLDIIHRYVLEQPVPERKPLFLPSDKLPTPAEQTKHDDNTQCENKQNEDVNGKRKAEGDGDAKEAQPLSKKQKRSKEKRTTDPNLTAMQGHLFQLLRPLVSKQTHIRDALARTRAGDIEGFERILSMVEDAVKEGILEYERDPGQFDNQHDDVDKLQGSKATIAEYGRPWWICQPYIRPLPEEALAIGALTASKKDQRKAAAAANAAEE